MDTKEVVRRFVDEKVNAGHDEVVDELFAPALTAWVHAGSARFGARSPACAWSSWSWSRTATPS